MNPYWFRLWWLRQRVAKAVCAALGHRLETRRDFDIEWDVCNRCRLYMTAFRSNWQWVQAMQDPMFVRALDQGLADYTAARVKPWSAVR